MIVNKGILKAYSRMGQKGASSGIGMVELGKVRPNIRAVVADSVAIASLDRFNNLYLNRVINVGIAEQNMISVAAGMASESEDCVFAFTYAAFITARALEQVRLNLGYHKFNVKIVGNSAGFAMEMLGVSHWAVEDIAYIRAIPNITILSPADSLEAIKAIKAAADIQGPVYVRLSGGANVPIVYDNDYDFQVGKAITLRDGIDTAIVATGMMVNESLKAAALLEEKGISCKVVNMHTIKPIDTVILNDVFKSYSCIFSIEEHSKIGGLASSIAEYKADKADAPVLISIGVDDTYRKLGTQEYIWRQYGLTAEQISETIYKQLIKK